MFILDLQKKMDPKNNPHIPCQQDSVLNVLESPPWHGLRVALHVGADLLPGLVVHVGQAADLHLGAVADLPGPVQCMEFHEMTKREIMGL